MWFDWFGLTNNNERQKQPGIAPLPSYRSDFDLVLLDAYFIPSSAKHPDQAWEWIRYLIQEQSASGIQIPPRKSLWESADYQARASADLVATARNLSPNTVVLVVGSGGSDYLQAVIHEFNLAVDDVIRGSLSAQDALSQAQSDAESLFQRMQKTKESSSP